MNKTFYNQNILIVDDSSFALEQLVKILDSYADNIFSADSAKKALKIFEKEDIDIVITDYSMPEINGIEFSKKLISLDPNVSIVLISALDEKNMLKEAIAIGVKQYIAKPLDVHQLINTVKNLAYTKELEKRVSLRLQQFNMIIGASSEVIVALNSEGKIFFANDQFYIKVKRSTDDLNFYDLMSPVNRGKIKGFIDSYTVENRESIILKSVESLGGGTYSCSVGEWANSEEKSYVIIMKDISVQLENKKNAQLFKNVFENSIEGILITDKDNEIITCNKAFEAITGYELDEIIGQQPDILKSGKHAKAFYAKMWDDINNKGLWSGTLFNRRKDGGIYYEHLTIFTIVDDRGDVINYVALFSDFNQKQQEPEISKLAYYDILTNLPNRFYFNEYLRKSITRALRQGGAIGVIYFDLDGFKKINDYFGHQVGDLLLCAVAEVINSQIRSMDVFARLGGDEFALIVGESDSRLNVESSCRMIAEKILTILQEPLICDGREISINASLGISIYPKDAKTTTDLLKYADIAMYESKKKGKGSYTFYNEQINEALTRELQIERLLASCNKDKEFEIYLQPQINSENEEVIGAEALLRWTSPDGGFISPGEFILVAENTGQIVDIDLWVLKKVAELVKKLKETGTDFPLSINLSAKSLEHMTNVNSIIEAIDNNYTGSDLVIEITESTLVKSIDNIEILTNHINKRGIYISIDDFGTGYSSLSYLKNIKAKSIKIDKIFIDEILLDSNASIIVESMVNMAATMGMTFVAEGAETKEQVEKLKEMKCNSVQGYYYSKPLCFDDFVSFISKNKVAIDNKTN